MFSPLSVCVLFEFYYFAGVWVTIVNSRSRRQSEAISFSNRHVGFFLCLTPYIITTPLS